MHFSELVERERGFITILMVADRLRFQSLKQTQCAGPSSRVSNLLHSHTLLCSHTLLPSTPSSLKYRVFSPPSVTTVRENLSNLLSPPAPSILFLPPQVSLNLSRFSFCLSLSHLICLYGYTFSCLFPTFGFCRPPFHLVWLSLTSGLSIPAFFSCKSSGLSLPPILLSVSLPPEVYFTLAVPSLKMLQFNIIGVVWLKYTQKKYFQSHQFIFVARAFSIELCKSLWS